jgi:hypothetical protein
MKFILLTLTLLLVGCATPWPACNDGFSQSSVLRQVADEHSVCLDDVGWSLILANGLAISVAQTYTASQALAAVDGWIHTLELGGLTLLSFRDIVLADIRSFPELIELTAVFHSRFSVPTPMDPDTGRILTLYLKDRVRPILLARVKG